MEAGRLMTAFGSIYEPPQGDRHGAWSHLARRAAPAIDFSRATLFAVVGGGSDAPAGKPVVVAANDDGGQTVVVWRTEGVG